MLVWIKKEYLDKHRKRCHIPSRLKMNKMTPEQKEFKDRLFKKCLLRCKKRNLQLLPKVEVLPYGYCQGSVSTFVERGTSGWSSSYGGMGMGNLHKKEPK